MNYTKILSLFLCLIMLFGVFPVSSAPMPVTVNDSEIKETVDVEVGALLADEEGDAEQSEVSDVFGIISEGIGNSAAYLGDELEEFHRNGSVAYGLEWHVVSLLRAGKTIDDEILLEYYNSLVETVKGWTVETTPTNIERCALAISAMDKDITDVDGVNLAELIYNNTALDTGSNKLVFALLALDAADVEIPENALWSREALITEILKYRTADGAFGLALDNLVSDVDMTAMCIQSLAPYTESESVNDAVNDAVEYLKRTASEEFDYLNNAYSTAQVLLALSCLGIDVADSDSGFGNGADENIVTALGKYKSENTNGYISENGVVSSSATYQVMQAYDAYRKAFKENLSYWDFSVKGQIYDDGGENEGEPDNNEQEAASANVYVTLVSDASVVTDKNGEYVAAAKVTVADLDKNGIHTVDEVLYAAHEAYYDGGAQEGYASQNTAYGLSVAKLWGKGSLEAPTSCGYYLNNNSCWSLADEVKEGDYLVAFNYYDTIGWSDSYSYFDVNTVEVNKGNTVTLTLNCLGYDASWNVVSSPYAGAKIKFIGNNSDILVTDENGKVEINTTEMQEGVYYAVAYTDEKNIVPAVCRVEIKNLINVFVTLVSDASIVTDKNGEYVAAAKVTVTDLDKNGIHTVDEVLYAAHEAYYDGGAQEGYASQNTAYGLSVAKLWGKGSLEAPTSCGYYLNNNSCWSLADEVKEGDYLVAFNYYDTIGWSDSYAYFDVNTTEVNKGKTVTLTLNCLGYDASWNVVSSPCKGAKVEILGSNNSAQKVLTTNKNGKVKINFPKSAESGDYYVVAYKDDNSIVPCVCRITVKNTNNTVDSGTTKDIKVYIKVSDPEGETYLKKVSYSVKKGTTAFELLEKTGLDIDVSRSVYGMYVSGIEDLAEFDEGEGSGWMYRVNGKFPSISSSMYTLSKGDYVEWLYTRDFGEDLGQSKSSGVSSSESDKEDVEEQITDVPQNTDKTQEEPQKNVFSDKTFADVKSDNWHYDSVKYVYENNLMQGTDNGFEPDSNMSRAMLVTVLYRMDNGTKSEYTHLFSDVSKENWYADAVSWAVSTGIIKGVTETEFAPNDNITREQTVTILYRYAKYKGYDVEVSAELSKFSDSDRISTFALDAFRWAIESGIINGTSVTTLSPKDTATRAQLAAILMRFCEREWTK